MSGLDKSNKNHFKRSLNILNFTQFLSAFADSVIIIIIAFMLKQSLHTNDENNPYIFLVESFFLFSYILFSPLVGTFADRNSKARVLLLGNVTKAIGIVLIIIGINPAFCYAIIGLGAAIYGPAKYAILNELTDNNKDLLNANGKLESFTILSIILGTLIGGILADMKPIIGELFCLGVYLISILMTFLIPSQVGNKSLSYIQEAKNFFKSIKLAFSNSKMRYSYIGSGSFWMISVVIKNGLFLWIPIHLGIKKGFPLTFIIGMTACGIVVGALLSRKFTSIETFYKANKFGVIVASLALIFPWISGFNHVSYIIVCVILFVIGIFAGMFVIPLNATLQTEGHSLFGVGKTVAVQNLVDNSMMFVGTYSVYLLNHIYHLSITGSLFLFALVYLSFVFYLTFSARKFQRN